MADRSDWAKYFRGVRNGSPVSAAYLICSTALGLMMAKAGFSVWEGLLMSMLILAGAGEFAAVSLYIAGASNFEIVLTNAILNARYFLQCSTVSKRLSPGCPVWWRALIGFTTADEAFSIATIGEQGLIDYHYMTGLNSIAYPGWQVGTVLGIILGKAGTSFISAELQASMSIALYGMFIGLLVPAAKKSRPVFFTIAMSASINIFIRALPMTKDINMGWSILISTVAASCTASALWPHTETEADK